MKRKSKKQQDPYIVLIRPNIPLAENTTLRPDLTPPDLLDLGYVIRPHRFAGFWCWSKPLKGGGQSWGEPRLDVEAACECARHHAGMFYGPLHETEGVLDYWDAIKEAELARWNANQ